MENNLDMEFLEKYVPKKYWEAIEDIETPAIGGEGYWITVKEGWIVTSMDSHTIHEYTLADMKKQLKYIEKEEVECIDEEVETVTLSDGRIVTKEKYVASLERHIERRAKEVEVLRIVVANGERSVEDMIKFNVPASDRIGLLKSDKYELKQAETALGKLLLKKAKINSNIKA